jgi:hypothetical protein
VFVVLVLGNQMFDVQSRFFREKGDHLQKSSSPHPSDNRNSITKSKRRTF